MAAEGERAEAFRKQLLNPLLLKGYFALKLPLAAMAGLRITALDRLRCEALVPFDWRTRNPFGSIYFAALAMAAELSSAGLALTAARSGASTVSALPVGLEAEFEKKATGHTRFLCEEGPTLYTAVERALETGEGVTCRVATVGRMDDGTRVASFRIMWSFKRK